MAKRKKINATDILTFYMNYVSEKGHKPKSVYNFAKDHNFEDDTFYEFYSSFEKLDQHIFKIFFDNTVTALQKSEEYVNYDSRNKLLSFYYTFFENLAANRSYVLVALKSNKKSLKPLKKLSKLKNNFESYINSLEIEKIDFNQEAIEKLQAQALKKAAWFSIAYYIKILARRQV